MDDEFRNDDVSSDDAPLHLGDDEDATEEDEEALHKHGMHDVEETGDEMQ